MNETDVFKQYGELHKRWLSAKDKYDYACAFNTWRRTPYEILENDLELLSAQEEMQRIEHEMSRLVHELEHIP